MVADERWVLERLQRWAEACDDVRAMILTSSRASPTTPVDILSDYDVIVYVRDVRPYYQSWDWLEHFGCVLVLYRDPILLSHGFEKFAYITQYEDGLKIDFTIATAEILPCLAAECPLDEALDVGYRVLLDKDGLSEGLQPPTYQAHIPRRPSEEEYLTRIELFFHEATYVAKHLWRDDLLAAKYNLDYAIKQNELRGMLEWHIEHDHDWRLKPGAYGRGLKRYLRPNLWVALEETYVGADLDENWDALFRTIDLFRQVAVEVGEQLGYAYPDELHHRTVAYLHWVRTLPHEND